MPIQRARKRRGKVHLIQKTVAELAVVQELAGLVFSVGSSRFSGNILNPEIFKYSTSVN